MLTAKPLLWCGFPQSFCLHTAENVSIWCEESASGPSLGAPRPLRVYLWRLRESLTLTFWETRQQTTRPKNVESETQEPSCSQQQKPEKATRTHRALIPVLSHLHRSCHPGSYQMCFPPRCLQTRGPGVGSSNRLCCPVSDSLWLLASFVHVVRFPFLQQTARTKYFLCYFCSTVSERRQH